MTRFKRIDDLIGGWEYRLAREPEVGQHFFFNANDDDSSYRIVRTEDWGDAFGFCALLIVYTYDDQNVDIIGVGIAESDDDAESEEEESEGD